MHTRLWAMALLALLAGCGKNTGVGGTAGDAMPATLQANEQMAAGAQARRSAGLRGRQAWPDRAPGGQDPVGRRPTVLVDFDAYKFVDGKAPPTVNPSLWRHAVLNAQVGLFKVTDGI